MTLRINYFLFRDIEANIQLAKQEIAKYKDDLQQARVIRRHRQEYDALAMVRQIRPPNLADYINMSSPNP